MFRYNKLNQQNLQEQLYFKQRKNRIFYTKNNEEQEIKCYVNIEVLLYNI